MGLVALAEEVSGAIVIAITEIELTGGRGHIQEGDVHLFRYLPHLPNVIHRVVVSWDRLILVEHSVLQLVELVAEVVLPVAANGAIVREVLTADRCHEYGCAA